MIEPLPNCFSICASAAASALPLLSSMGSPAVESVILEPFDGSYGVGIGVFMDFGGDYGIERTFDPVVERSNPKGRIPPKQTLYCQKLTAVEPILCPMGSITKGDRLSRAERLLALIQILYRHRHPVSGAMLADELRVSLRTLYRDIASLQAQGAHIDGEPGMGYVLKPGFMLPPLMFSEEEIEALVLGSRWVADRGDSELAEAARNVLAKIGAVLPADLRHELDASTL